MPSTRTTQQAQRRDRVIAAAMALAAKGGYEAVQMRAVSQEADVALGTIYRYFSSKDQLLLAGLEQLAVEMHEQLKERPPKGRDAHQRVSEVFRRCCALLEAEPQVTHAMITAMSSSDPAIAEPSSAVQQQLGQMIHEAVADDDIDDIDDIVHVLGQVWFSSMISFVSGRSEDGAMAANLELATRLLLKPRS